MYCDFYKNDLAEYVKKETGKGLSTNDFTDDDKNKLKTAYENSGKTAGASIQTATIYDIPFGKPELYFTTAIQESVATCAKPSVFKDSNKYIITYGENVDGNNKDIPEVSESGVLEMKYRIMEISEKNIVSSKYGVFAKIGDSYTDYEGNSKKFVGGCGLPSAVSNMQYFSSVESWDKYNNGSKQKFIPCCCTVSVNQSDAKFGDIKELTLTINDVKGQFDLSRLGYTSLYNYYTTNPPYKDDNGFYWTQSVPNGIAYLTSNNGIDWTYKFTIKTAYEPRYEVSCCKIVGNNGEHLVFASRTGWDKQALYVGAFDLSGNILWQYKLNDIGSRPLMLRSGNDVLLFHTLRDSRNHGECIRITDESYGFGFYKWFDFYNKMTWYPFANAYAIKEKNFEYMYMCGGNGKLGNGKGMNFSILKFDSSQPRTIDDMDILVK